jgi:hypothetical protein
VLTHRAPTLRPPHGEPKAQPFSPPLPCFAWNWRSLACFLFSKALGLQRFCNLLGLQFITRPEPPWVDAYECGPEDCRKSFSSPPLEPADIWEPWPAREPYADEITRWWPSDEYPPLQPSIVYEDRIPDRPPVIAMHALGGLVDAYA